MQTILLYCTVLYCTVLQDLVPGEDMVGADNTSGDNIWEMSPALSPQLLDEIQEELRTRLLRNKTLNI